MRRTRGILTVVLLAATLGAAMLFAPSASAYLPTDTVLQYAQESDPVERCNNHLTYDSGERGEVCIVQDTPEGSRWGLLRYVNIHGESYYAEGTVYVQRCQAGGVNCSTIAANSGEGFTTYGVWAIRTSAKPASYGWVYRACASLDAHWPTHAHLTDSSFVNRCSPWMGGDPTQ